nr:MAG TPA: hypothetical protein [Caudoviricetes sp.]
MEVISCSCWIIFLLPISIKSVLSIIKSICIVRSFIFSS